MVLKVLGRGGTRQYPLTRAVIAIGRARDNDLVLDEDVVSRYHARLEQTKDLLHITDLASTNGTAVNGKLIRPQVAYPVNEGDTIRIAGFTLMLSRGEPPTDGAESEMQTLELSGRVSLTIGRAPGNTLRLPHPTVSRRHASIVQREPSGDYAIEDLGSTNGTFVNGERVVQPRLLAANDIVRIGPYKLVYKPERLRAVDESRYLQLHAFHLRKSVRKGTNLLKDISLAVEPCEFVGIVGLAGAGKSTLLGALNGFAPATEGTVLVNGMNLYPNLDAFRTQIGYVPQRNIIHSELTAYETLIYSARLRLPSDTTPKERHRRVMEVLDTLGIAEAKDRPVRHLSGGEQRRVSIGVELLAQPGLFFLDEATSGLDPGNEHLMMRLLRKLASQGHTVLLVTHATRNIRECDLVVFLARGGFVAYCGPPDRALAYFGVKDFDDIYRKLETEGTPEEWAAHYRASEDQRVFITERLLRRPPTLSAPSTHPSVPTSRLPLKRVSDVRQFAILLRRSVNVLARGRMSLLLTLLMPPAVGALDFLFWEPGLFAADEGDAMQAIRNLFMVAVVCCVVGVLASMGQIVNEEDIYRRERMVTLRIVPYASSKLCIAGMVALYAAGMFILFMRLAGDWPPPEIALQVYATLALAVLAGELLGLLISALSPNPDVTPLLLILVLTPQILFGGMIPPGKLGKAGEVISYATTTKWSFESLVTISSMGKSIADDPCWQLPEDEQDPRAEQELAENCTCKGPGLFETCNFPGIRKFQKPVLDESKPPKSASAKYQEWKAKRTRATFEAEAYIRRMKGDYGHSFDVCVWLHWGVLTGVIAILFGLVVGVLRSKDPG